MKRFFCLLMLLMLPVLALADGTQKVFKENETEPFPEDAQLLTLTVCPLLGADCMLLTYGEHSLLVDVAKDVTIDTVLQMLKDAGLDSVEGIFSTHPHRDHISGVVPLLESGIGVGTFYTVFPHDYVERKGTRNYTKYTLKALAERNIPVVDLKTEDTIPCGDVLITVLRIPDEYIRKWRTCNEMSAMLKISYGDCSLLLTADVEPTDNSQGVLADLYDLKADILKVPHHGMGMMRKEFLKRTDPEFVFITHSASNTQRAQKFLIHNGYTWINFATWGPIIARTDGNKWIVRQEYLPGRENMPKTYKFPK